MKVPANSLPIEGLCPAHRHLFVVFLHSGRSKGAVWDFFLNKGTNFIHESSTLMSESLPRGTTFKYHHIGGIGLNVYLAGTKTLNL